MVQGAPARTSSKRPWPHFMYTVLCRPGGMNYYVQAGWATSGSPLWGPAASGAVRLWRPPTRAVHDLATDAFAVHGQRLTAAWGAAWGPCAAAPPWDWCLLCQGVSP